MSKIQKYIDSVDGEAHQSAVTIIAELEHELEKCQFCYDKTLPLAERIAELEEHLRVRGERKEIDT